MSGELGCRIVNKRGADPKDCTKESVTNSGFDEPDCSAYPLEVMAMYALYQSG